MTRTEDAHDPEPPSYYESSASARVSPSDPVYQGAGAAAGGTSVPSYRDAEASAGTPSVPAPPCYDASASVGGSSSTAVPEASRRRRSTAPGSAQLRDGEGRGRHSGDEREGDADGDAVMPVGEEPPEYTPLARPPRVRAGPWVTRLMVFSGPGGS